MRMWRCLVLPLRWGCALRKACGVFLGRAARHFQLAVFRPSTPARATTPGSELRSFGGSKTPGQLVLSLQGCWLWPYRGHVTLLTSEGWSVPVHPAESRSLRSWEDCTSHSALCPAGS